MINEIVMNLIQKNNGVLQAEQVRKAGIDNKVLQRMEANGEILRIGRGLYMDVDYMEDEYFLTQYRCKKGIYSHETALFFHELCDRTPFRLAMTIPNGYNSRLLKDKKNYQFFYCKQDAYALGISSMVSPQGNKIKVYNKERTICDCIKKKDKLDADLVLVAVKQYMREPGNDYALLLKYAEIFKIRDTVKQYMEVLA